jgi:hypothetical protein
VKGSKNGECMMMVMLMMMLMMMKRNNTNTRRSGKRVKEDKMNTKRKRTPIGKGNKMRKKKTIKKKK